MNNKINFFLHIFDTVYKFPQANILLGSTLCFTACNALSPTSPTDSGIHLFLSFPTERKKINSSVKLINKYKQKILINILKTIKQYTPP